MRDSKRIRSDLLAFSCQASNLFADSSVAPSEKCTPRYHEHATIGQAFLAQHSIFVNEKAGRFGVTRERCNKFVRIENSALENGFRDILAYVRLLPLLQLQPDARTLSWTPRLPMIFRSPCLPL